MTAVNLAAALALSGHKTLLIDCDPQGSAAFYAGRYTSDGEKNLLSASLGQKPLNSILCGSCLDYLKVISAPGERQIRAEEQLLKEKKDSLFRSLVSELKTCFDFILLDTSPDTSPFTIASLCAADSVLIPLQCEYLAFNNLGQTVDTLKWVKKEFQPHLKLAGILLTMVATNSSATRRITAAANKHLNKALFTSVIPRSERFQETPGYRKPLVLQDHTSPEAASYMELAKELIERERFCTAQHQPTTITGDES